ncbi:Translationally-controlled tumor protein [Penicillium longicatenatum]|uniref:Translationally-controlled tumor protein n=1 Tax=Penicillium longicatenatum TaxID=1561947 RepID=UPI0025496740|nr:Translationally-controlled tumor protein [Penicillium longicatenatum]KAJ5648850.1 Translationally-controlled tumor protein [Penicillium longicatenatum]
MIIYTDIISGDEILSDTYKITPAEDCPILWETNCRKYTKKVGEDFELAGANPSAEDAADDDNGEAEMVMVHDIEDQFRLVWLKVEEGLKPSKDAFKAHLKAYIKKINKALTDKGDEEAVKEFQKHAGAAMKKIIANYDDYDILMGQSMNGDAMHVLINFREDGVTPFATVWKHGFKEIKV